MHCCFCYKVKRQPCLTFINGPFWSRQSQKRNKQWKSKLQPLPIQFVSIPSQSLRCHAVARSLGRNRTGVPSGSIACPNGDNASNDRETYKSQYPRNQNNRREHTCWQNSVVRVLGIILLFIYLLLYISLQFCSWKLCPKYSTEMDPLRHRLAKHLVRANPRRKVFYYQLSADEYGEGAIVGRLRRLECVHVPNRNFLACYFQML